MKDIPFSPSSPNSGLKTRKEWKVRRVGAGLVKRGGEWSVVQVDGVGDQSPLLGEGGRPG